MTQRDTSIFVCKGGLDLETPITVAKPGRLLLSYNHEPVPTGYQRVEGFERYDGRTSPSSERDPVDIEALRSLITSVPGEGNVLGVHIYNNEVYAFRNNVGSTAANMFKASGTGWSVITTPTLLPDGSYKFINANFYGSASSLSMYGVDGVNNGFEFDGTTYSPITTGMVLDAPINVIEHNLSLCYAFPDGSLQFSPVGTPGGSWALRLGATEVGVGDEIAALGSLPGGATGVWCRNKIEVIRGSNPATYYMENFSREVGCVDGILETMSESVFLDDRGLTKLSSSQAFGDFKDATIAPEVDTLLASIHDATKFSTTVPDKNHLKIFYITGANTTKAVTFLFKGNKVDGIGECEYPFEMTCVTSGEINGINRVFAGAADGHVYELNAGNSFDGQSVLAYLRFHYMNMNRPTVEKTLRGLILDITSASEITGKYQFDYEYGSAEIPTSLTKDKSTAASGGFWNISTWNNFVWGNAFQTPTYLDAEGTAENFGLYMYTNLQYEYPYIVHSGHWLYNLRKRKRYG